MELKQKIVAIIQARMNSSRLPGKVLLELGSKPVILHVVTRLYYCKNLDQVVLATTESKEDDQLFDFCEEKNINVFRGSEDDVLDRYLKTAEAFDATLIVRITGDCPLIDPLIVDGLIKYYEEGEYDVCGFSGEFPDGLDCEIFSFNALKDAHERAVLKSEREHVTPYFYKNKKRYKVGEFKIFEGLNHHRWTLDEPRDYQLLTAIFNKFSNNEIFYTQDILDFLEKFPELLEMNNKITRNEGYIKSLERDQLID